MCWLAGGRSCSELLRVARRQPYWLASAVFVLSAEAAGQTGVLTNRPLLSSALFVVCSRRTLIAVSVKFSNVSHLSPKYNITYSLTIELSSRLPPLRCSLLPRLAPSSAIAAPPFASPSPSRCLPPHSGIDTARDDQVAVVHGTQ